MPATRKRKCEPAPTKPRSATMACSRAAVSVGNLASVARMKGRYGSMRLGRSGEVCTGAQLPASTRRTASRCTCSCRAMVPTRHFSTVCRRRICATRSGAMVIAPPRRQAVAHEAQTQRRGLSLAAAAAGPAGGGDGELRRRAVRDGVGGRVSKFDGSAVVCPCHQWSPGHPRPGTLVRHVMGGVACTIGSITGSAALAPAPGPPCVSDATAPRALVALRGLAPSLGAGLVPALTAAVAVAAVAAAAQDDLHAA